MESSYPVESDASGPLPNNLNFTENNQVTKKKNINKNNINKNNFNPANGYNINNININRPSALLS